MLHHSRMYSSQSLLLFSLLVSFVHPAPAQIHPSVVLVELFTSEGCSDCPAADDLLRRVSGQITVQNQFVVGLSEHVSYWNRLGWKDPFSSDLYTNRQGDYGRRFRLDSVYTPQMVVNGREQFVGSDRRALEKAFAAEAQHKQIKLRIDSARMADGSLVFSYSASDLPANHGLELVAAFVDDVDSSKVLRGENSGRDLTHVAVARALAAVGPLQEGAQRLVTMPLPPSFASNPETGHHLVLFAQEKGTGAILGADIKPI